MHKKVTILTVLTWIGDRYAYSWNWYNDLLKSVFFWDQSQDMSSSEVASDCLTYLVYQLEALFFLREATWTHVLTWISEKIDFKLSYCAIMTPINV